MYLHLYYSHLSGLKLYRYSLHLTGGIRTGKEIFFASKQLFLYIKCSAICYICGWTRIRNKKNIFFSFVNSEMYLKITLPSDIHWDNNKISSNKQILFSFENANLWILLVQSEKGKTIEANSRKFRQQNSSSDKTSTILELTKPQIFINWATPFPELTATTDLG